MLGELSSRALSEWIAFYQVEAEDEAAAAKAAERDAKAGRQGGMGGGGAEYLGQPARHPARRR